MTKPIPLRDLAAYCQTTQAAIYQQNKEKGWHDEPRSFAQFTCLFHSEVSEGVEGLRKLLMDTHLVEFPMLVVEMADTFIRVLDYLGMKNISWDDGISEWSLTDDRPTDLANLHACLSEAWLQRGNLFQNYQLQRAAVLAWRIVEAEGYDMAQIVATKLNYNKHRPDHMKAARDAAGGKKW
ncbi:hypothetical protein [Vibrio phage VpV262]|uniref:Uncharacterized protein n=1 Tax=Vibrio phage VpV262 TaxID=2907796 RepID=Q8LT71_9CAUD|nr:pyrophosphatase [Vibrio phage VpV262]AAM28381.1 hypothetical protein [Vibrio phage VpV262]